MIKRVVTLVFMIFYDFSLHLVESLDCVDLHPLYPTFPIFGISYNLFWTVYWGFALFLAFTLLFAGGKNARSRRRR